MQVSFLLERYSRCYPKEEDQYSDLNGIPLFSLLPRMTTTTTTTSSSSSSQNTKIHAGIWTTIENCKASNLYLQLNVVSKTKAELSIGAGINPLEAFEFPTSVKKKQFRMQFKPTSVGVRYMKDGFIRLFQATFADELQCQLFFEQISRFGCLGPCCWDNLFIFNGSDMANCDVNNYFIDDIGKDHEENTNTKENTNSSNETQSTQNTQTLPSSQESTDFSFMTPTALQ